MFYLKAMQLVKGRLVAVKVDEETWKLVTNHEIDLSEAIRFFVSQKFPSLLDPSQKPKIVRHHE